MTQKTPSRARRAPPEPPSPDEAMRLSAAGHLSTQIGRSLDFIDRCEHLAAVGKHNKLAAINAAAAMMRANAMVAGAFARLAQVETRHRTIVEMPQGVGGKGGGLNSPFHDPARDQDIRATLERRFARIAEAAARDKALEEARAEEAARKARETRTPIPAIERGPQ